ncbi:Ibd2p LALA0_S02e04258g [Lachancea lanzarotensis]|uniref:Protein IBD2 n=1 Tax=Lachancea lanzarotensis TaxID=1245769 RepID=A0A0C7MU66_9SACH|nr:uncharacterized protein LALA0_S02e04258g [Lachancea lanzarotensis]CEP60989.1 LALA0S02e04258g1_1 [Lachancea lanzarotensis]
MSFSKKTSADGIPEDERGDFNAMMQEGVKALTNMLTTHLQEDSGRGEPSSKYTSSRESSKSKTDTQRLLELIKTENFEKMDSDELVESIQKSRGSDELVPRANQTHLVGVSQERITEVVDAGSSAGHRQERDMDLHKMATPMTSEKDQIVFDTGEHELLSFPEEFSDNLKKMVASSLAQHAPHGSQPNIDFDFDVDVDVDVGGMDMPMDMDMAGRTDEPALPQPSSASRPHSHSHCCHENRDAFQYPRGPRSAPDFSKLINNDRPMCLFCEYYVVFGEPPKNMIRWFDRVRGQTAASTHSPQHTQR